MATIDLDSKEKDCQLPSQRPDMTAAEMSQKPGLKASFIKLVNNDDAKGLQEALEAEWSASSKPSRKISKRCSASGSKEEDFSSLRRRLLHYTCALDAVDCCTLLLTSQSFPAILVDAIDELDQRSPLHVASFNHSKRCIEVLCKQGASLCLKNKHLAVPLEEALFSEKLNVDWDFDTPAAQIVTRVGEKDLAALRKLEPRSKDLLIRIAFKLAKGLKLVPLVALLIVTNRFDSHLLNFVAMEIEGQKDSMGTLVDVLVGKALRKSSSSDDKPKRSPSARDVEWKRTRSARDVEWKRVEIVQDKSTTVEEEVGTDWKIARKLLECVLLFRPRLSAHSKSCALPPLIRAAQTNDEALLSLLLESGAPINAKDCNGNTALHWALREATPAHKRSFNGTVAKLLLDAGANVLLWNRIGVTPVHTSAGHGHYEALKLILDKEAPSCVNVLTAKKETPLHYSVKNDNLLCTALLLTHGANRNVRKYGGQKPFQLATSSEMRDLLSLDEAALRELPPHSLLKTLSKMAQKQPRQQATLQGSTSDSAGLLQSCPNLVFQRDAQQLLVNDPHRIDDYGKSDFNLPAWKTVFCRNFWNKKGCRWGENCNFAHSEEELRAGQQKQPNVELSSLFISEISSPAVPRYSPPSSMPSNGSVNDGVQFQASYAIGLRPGWPTPSLAVESPQEGLHSFASSDQGREILIKRNQSALSSPAAPYSPRSLTPSSGSVNYGVRLPAASEIGPGWSSPSPPLTPRSGSVNYGVRLPAASEIGPGWSSPSHSLTPSRGSVNYGVRLPAASEIGPGWSSPS